MEQNVGGLDRTARLVAGPILLLVGIAAFAELLPLGTTVGALAAVVGLVFLVTGLTRTCILNRLLGIDTSRR
ncbi:MULTISPECIES: YgaP family membrane protein [Salinibaculum]|uniref:YgaP family membrane protein n=1 Tax=Salinibaculum TaxID=2732368 RepID=UPI0030CB61FB